MLRTDPRSWPIRWRLTALSVGVLVATLLVLGGVFQLLLDSALIDITADHLRDQARPVLRIMRGPRPGPPSESERSPPASSSFSLPRVAGLMVRGLSGPDTGALIYDAAGTLVGGSETSEEVEGWPQPTTERLRAALAGNESSEVIAQQTRRTLLLLLPLHAPDGEIVGVLALGGSLQLVDQLQARLRAALVVGTLLATLIAGVLGVRATRAALRPLDRVIHAARKIGAGELRERLRLKRSDEIGELAEAFDGMLDRLAVVLAAQRRFVADAAHELRTPLTALGGMVEMLQLGADRGDQTTVRRMLDTMDHEIGRLGRLVADLLTLSRLDAEQPLVMAPVRLGPLVKEVANQTRLLANGQQVEHRIEVEPTILGDADRLKQVLINLAANALAFTPADGRIEFRLVRERGTARLQVADTGSGIPPDILPRVMDRFVRGDRSRARSTGGSGLGLAIARGIVEAHGGTIALDSQMVGGTTVTIVLPLAATGVPSGKLQVSPTEDSGPREKVKV